MGCKHCGKPLRARGLCAAHYSRWSRHGDALAGLMRGEALAYLKSLVGHAGNDCIDWPFKARMPFGYGSMRYEGRTHGAHRVMCVLAHGPSESLYAAHSCGRPVCVNPNHIRWATPSENSADKIMHGTYVTGEKHHSAKLSDDEVREIRAMAANGHLQKTIAQHFGIDKSHVCAIIKGKYRREAAIMAMSNVAAG